MKVLVACSGNSGRATPFVREQARDLRRLGVQVEMFLIQGKGISGYLRNLKPLVQCIAEQESEIVHAHYGLSGLLAILQKRVPVVVTFHGSDVRFPRENLLSSVASMNAKWRIFVSEFLSARIFIKPTSRFSIIPCGVDLYAFRPVDKMLARQKLGLARHKKYVLFSSTFSNLRKNYALASAAVERIGGAELVELQGYSREEVNLLMNACDVALLTSHYEGAATQFLKEAMACNRPIVTVDVNDAAQLVAGVDGCFVCKYEPDDVADKLLLAMQVARTISGRERVSAEAGELVARKVLEVYRSALRRPEYVGEARHDGWLRR